MDGHAQRGIRCRNWGTSSAEPKVPAVSLPLISALRFLTAPYLDGKHVKTEMLEAYCGSGPYLAAVVAISDKQNWIENKVLCFAKLSDCRKFDLTSRARGRSL